MMSEEEKETATATENAAVTLPKSLSDQLEIFHAAAQRNSISQPRELKLKAKSPRQRLFEPPSEIVEKMEEDERQRQLEEQEKTAKRRKKPPKLNALNWDKQDDLAGPLSPSEALSPIASALSSDRAKSKAVFGFDESDVQNANAAADAKEQEATQ